MKKILYKLTAIILSFLFICTISTTSVYADNISTCENAIQTHSYFDDDDTE